MPKEKEISKLKSNELDEVSGGVTYYLLDGRGNIAQYQDHPFEIIDQNGDVIHRCDSEKTAREIFRKAYPGDRLKKTNWPTVRSLRASKDYNRLNRNDEVYSFRWN